MNVRHQKERVSKHMTSLASQVASNELVRIPAYITGVRRQYLESIQAEAEARREYELLRNEPTSNGLHPDSKPHENLLRNHVNALRQREQHAKLESLTNHVDRLESLLPRGIELLKLDWYDTEDSDVDGYLCERREYLKDLTRKLEIDVIEAKRVAVREQTALEAAQVRRNMISSSVSRVSALNVVRSELNSWIEENLAACGVDDSNLEPNEDKVERQIPLNGVDNAYTEYIDARKKVITALNSLLSPLEKIDNDSIVSRIPERTKQPPHTDITFMAEDQYPRWQIVRSLTSLRSFAQAELAAEEDGAEEILQRLADESQLLPSYPISSHASRFKSKLLSEQHTQNKIDSKVGAWSFAAEAADGVVHAGVRKDVESGNEAIKRAEETVQELDMLRASALPGKD